MFLYNMGNNSSNNYNNDYSEASATLESLSNITTDSNMFNIKSTYSQAGGGKKNHTGGGDSNESHIDLLNAIEDKINESVNGSSDDSEFYKIIENKLNQMGGKNNTDIFIKNLEDNNYNNLDTITPQEILKNIKLYGGEFTDSYQDNAINEAYTENTENTDDTENTEDEDTEDNTKENKTIKNKGTEEDTDEDREIVENSGEDQEETTENSNIIENKEGGRVYLPFVNVDDDSSDDSPSESSATETSSSSDFDEDEDYKKKSKARQHKGKKIRLLTNNQQKHKNKKDVHDIFLTSASESTPYLLSTSSMDTDDVNIINYSP